jgi:hypothetical protein
MFQVQGLALAKVTATLGLEHQGYSKFYRFSYFLQYIHQ